MREDRTCCGVRDESVVRRRLWATSLRRDSVLFAGGDVPPEENQDFEVHTFSAGQPRIKGTFVTLRFSDGAFEATGDSPVHPFPPPPRGLYLQWSVVSGSTRAFFTFLPPLQRSTSRFSTFNLSLCTLSHQFSLIFLPHGPVLHFHGLPPLPRSLRVTVDGVISQTVAMAKQVFSKWAFERSRHHHHHSTPVGGWDV